MTDEICDVNYDDTKMTSPEVAAVAASFHSLEKRDGLFFNPHSVHDLTVLICVYIPLYKKPSGFPKYELILHTQSQPLLRATESLLGLGRTGLDVHTACSVNT